MKNKALLTPLFSIALLILNACGGGQSKSVSSTTDHPDFSWAKVAISNNYSPSGNSTNQTPTFTWPAIHGATEYHLGHEGIDNLASSSDWVDYTIPAAEAGCATGSTCTYKPANKILSVVGTPWINRAWWIRGKVNKQWEKWSAPYMFTVLFDSSNAPTTPTPINPKNDDALISENLVFTFEPINNTQKTIIGYENKNGTEWVQESISANKKSFIPTTKLKKGSYTWWVRALLKNGNWTSWSYGSDFKITKNPVNPQQPTTPSDQELTEDLDSDSDEDGVSDEDEIRHNSDLNNPNSYPDDLLKITNNETNKITFQARRLELHPKNTNGLIRTNHRMWAQGITYLKNETYLTSQNLYEKNSNTGDYEETYTLFNLLDKHGNSIGNIQLDYKSHAQGLSIQKISDTIYHIYTVSSDGLSIGKFIFDVSNIDFNNIDYAANIPLNIKFSNRLPLPNVGTSITPSLNFEKNKFITIGYVGSKLLKIHTIDKNSLDILKVHEFDLEIDSNGYYNQGASMKDGIIYLVRGHWGNEGNKAIKRLFVIDYEKNKLIASYSFNIKNSSEFYRSEPEGVTIIGNELFLQLATSETKSATSKRKLRLYKLINTFN